MKTKKNIIKMLIFLLLPFCLTGCGGQEAAGEENIGLTEEVSEDGDIRKEPKESNEEDIAKDPDSQLTDGIAGEMEKEEETIKKELTKEEISPAVKEIPVDFPFWSSALMEDVDYFSLTLAELKEPAGEYELRLYNQNGDVLQQVSCGKLTEPIEILFGDFNDYSDRHANDMEIFSAGSSKGLYIRWDDLGLRFGKDAVEIPRYDEVRNWKMLVLEDGDTYQVRKILELGQAYGQEYLEVRRWLLNRKTGLLSGTGTGSI